MESDSVSVKSSQHAAGAPAGSRSPKTTPATPSSSVSPGDDQSRLSGRRQRSTRRGQGSSGCRRQTFRRSLGLHGDHRGAAPRRPVGAQRVTQEPHKSLPRGAGGRGGDNETVCDAHTHGDTHEVHDYRQTPGPTNTYTHTQTERRCQKTNATTGLLQYVCTTVHTAIVPDSLPTTPCILLLCACDVQWQ